MVSSTLPSFLRRGDQEVSPARLYVIRAVALLGLFGLFDEVTRLAAHGPTERGMVNAMLSGLWLMGFFMIRHPLKMVPLLLFEFAWKTMWLLAYGLPQWWSGVGAPSLGQDLFGIGAFSVVFALVIPWGYVWRHYVKAPAERWR